MPTLPIEGWSVAHTELERPFASCGEADRVFLLRSERHWTLVTLSLALPLHDQGPRLVGGSEVNAETFTTLDDLGEAVRVRYDQAGWVRLLDAGCERDAELHRAWAPTRAARDFDQASLRCPDLAAGGAMRQVPCWPVDAMTWMACRLGNRGFEVVKFVSRVVVDDEAGANPVLGVIDLRRDGCETQAVVRVDDAGEVYVRLADDEDAVLSAAVERDRMEARPLESRRVR